MIRPGMFHDEKPFDPEDGKFKRTCFCCKKPFDPEDGKFKRTCFCCKKPFVPDKDSSVYCSDECKQKIRRFGNV
jgi:hypothetical protein